MPEACVGTPGPRSQIYRKIWAAAHGPIPTGVHLHHECGNPWCENVDHLKPMTHAEHVATHRPTHCPHGHEYTPENTYTFPGTAYRYCRSCKRVRERDRKRAMSKAANRPPAAALRTHCPHGHEYTPENTYITRDGWRDCRACSRLSTRARYAARRNR